MIDELRLFFITWGFLGAFAAAFNLTDNYILIGPGYWIGWCLKKFCFGVTLLFIKLSEKYDTNISE